jgi:hypothetical protein
MAVNLKTASASERTAGYTRIVKVTGDDQFFTRKELEHLPEILSDGERVLAFASGLMDGNTWLIALTDRRIVFLDKGIFYGLKQATIDLDKVNAVGRNRYLLWLDFDRGWRLDADDHQCIEADGDAVYQWGAGCHRSTEDARCGCGPGR